MDKYLSFWQDTVDVEDFRRWHNMPAHINEFTEIVNKIIDKQYKSVLDCGAGLGGFYDYLTINNINIDYQGLEITKKFVDISTDAGIPMILGNIEKIPYKKNSFDVCLASDVLNHLYDYKAPIREMLRVAKKEVIVTFFKPSMEKLKYLSPEVRKKTIGWYPGQWDSSNMPATCPKGGFYPHKHNHCPLLVLQKNHKIYKSPLGLYIHSEEDESGEPTCIHHFFEMRKFFDFLGEVAIENGEEYRIYYGGDPRAREEYQRSTKEPNTPALKYYAHRIYIEKQGDH